MDIGHVHWLITTIADLKKIQFFFFSFFWFLKFFLDTFHVWRACSHSFSTEGMVASPPDLECA
jgi:hypothetical protein